MPGARQIVQCYTHAIQPSTNFLPERQDEKTRSKKKQETPYYLSRNAARSTIRSKQQHTHTLTLTLTRNRLPSHAPCIYLLPNPTLHLRKKIPPPSIHSSPSPEDGPPLTPTPGVTLPYPRGSARAGGAGGGGGALPPPRIAGDEFKAAALAAAPPVVAPRREVEAADGEALPLLEYWSNEDPGGRALAEGDTEDDEPGPRFRPGVAGFLPWMFWASALEPCALVGGAGRGKVEGC